MAIVLSAKLWYQAAFFVQSNITFLNYWSEERKQDTLQICPVVLIAFN